MKAPVGPGAAPRLRRHTNTRATDPERFAAWAPRSVYRTWWAKGDLNPCLDQAKYSFTCGFVPCRSISVPLVTCGFVFES